MGAGRSGSTILGVALGNCDGVFYAGELDAWLRANGEPAYAKPETQAFWAAVRRRLRGYQDLVGEDCLRCLEHSTALVRPARWGRARRLRMRYRRFSRELFEAVAETAACSVVVDTAHYPLRARELRAVADLDVHLVLLVRDAHAVVESFRQTSGRGRKGLVAANAYLWLTHLLSLAVFLTHPRRRRLLVRYESFLADPTGTVRAVLDMVGMPATLVNVSDLDTGRALAGNRILAEARLSVGIPQGRVGLTRSVVTTLAQAFWMAAARQLERQPPTEASAPVAELGVTR
jgi:hypothetical protein